MSVINLKKLTTPHSAKMLPCHRQPSSASVVAALLQPICGSHRLPLAVTWASCLHHSLCISTVDSASFASDDDSRCFLAACSDHHLLRSQGIAGRAFATNRRCFATDVAVFTNSTYPLSHYARMFHLHAALAVPLRSRATGAVEMVLELFFPRESRDTATQRQTLNALVAALHQRFRSSRHLLVVDEELAEEVIFPIAENSKQPTLVQEASPEECPWISHMVEANRRGKDVALSWEYQREEEFNITTMSRSQGDGQSSSSCVDAARRRRAEKEITLEVLRQHFAGSLKEAAKSIGVCPTTLKRICREKGIKRWPSRKIKKVGQSLRKLQLVMDSVKGVEGSLHLTSFYSAFPPTSSSSSSGSTTPTSAHLLLHNTCRVIHDNKTPPPPPPPRPPLPAAKPTTTTSVGGKDAKGIRLKATFGESKARLILLPHWRLHDVRREIAMRFALDVATNFTLKYLDDDTEWVLLTCDADLDECIHITRSSRRHTIRMLVHHSLAKPIP